LGQKVLLKGWHSFLFGFLLDSGKEGARIRPVNLRLVLHKVNLVLDIGHKAQLVFCKLASVLEFVKLILEPSQGLLQSLVLLFDIKCCLMEKVFLRPLKLALYLPVLDILLEFLILLPLLGHLKLHLSDRCLEILNLLVHQVVLGVARLQVQNNLNELFLLALDINVVSLHELVLVGIDHLLDVRVEICELFIKHLVSIDDFLH
jgi:hypothetical protein